MKSKSTVALAAVLAVLIALVVVKKLQDKPQTIVEQVRLARLLPEGVTRGDVTKLELYLGSKPDAKIVLTRDEGGDAWRVTSSYNVPADAKTIDGYLDKLSTLRGELRVAGSEQASLESYDLTDDKAFHVVGYAKGSDQPAFHLLSGKSPSFQQTFVRMADAKDVYVSDVDFKREAGVWESPSTPGAPGTPPSEGEGLKATQWVKKEVLNVSAAEITSLALAMPDKKLTFERHERPAAPESTDGAAPADTANPEATDAAAGEGTAGSDKKPQFEWAVAEGGPGTPLKQTALDNLLRGFGPLTATDVADPAKKAELGLDPPAFTATLKVSSQEQPVVVEGGRPDAKGDGYIRVAGAKEDVVYKVTASMFERIFPKGATLFDLPVLSADAQKVDRVEITQPEGRVVAVRSNGAWTVAEPAADLKVQTSSLDALARVLATWRAADYATVADGTGLDAPERRVVYTAGPETRHDLAVGGLSKTTEGHYARLDSQPQILVMSQSDYNTVFIAPKNLYERGLFDLMESDITGISFESADNTFQLAREGEAWKLTTGGATTDADKAAVDTFLSALAMLQADDILFGQAALSAAPVATIRITAAGGVQHVLNLGPKDEAGYPVVVSGKNAVLRIKNETAVAIMPPADSLKRKEPAPAAAAEGTAAPAPTEPAVAAPAATQGGAAIPAEGGAVAAPAPGEAPAAPTATSPSIPAETAPGPAEVAPAPPAPTGALTLTVPGETPAPSVVLPAPAPPAPPADTAAPAAAPPAPPVGTTSQGAAPADASAPAQAPAGG